MEMIAPVTPKSWYLPSKPHKFCPGCGHGIVLKALGEVIDELEIQDQTIFGCDIGCSLLSWNFFACDSTQTHHGRTTPVMVGIKRSRPELICVGYMGDGGGYSIGSQHLVNSAVRNEKVTLILVNNTNYGMTYGIVLLHLILQEAPGLFGISPPVGRTGRQHFHEREPVS
ncbi:MAG TPA: thiamine pyrophosphate-dependent enzyme, partial [Syntrophomonadaceae bacterium]|nr:thiamine pyrophosphate-dependent enzyme [Syntrophomonadaceae bacterium]